MTWKKFSIDHLWYFHWIWITRNVYEWHGSLGPVSLSNKTSYRKILWNLETTRLAAQTVISLWIWKVSQQQCCWDTCQISQLSDNSKHKFISFKTLQYLIIRRLIRYWNDYLDFLLIHNLNSAFSLQEQSFALVERSCYVVDQWSHSSLLNPLL